MTDVTTVADRPRVEVYTVMLGEATAPARGPAEVAATPDPEEATQTPEARTPRHTEAETPERPVGRATEDKPETPISLTRLANDKNTEPVAPAVGLQIPLFRTPKQTPAESAPPVREVPDPTRPVTADATVPITPPSMAVSLASKAEAAEVTDPRTPVGSRLWTQIPDWKTPRQTDAETARPPLGLGKRVSADVGEASPPRAEVGVQTPLFKTPRQRAAESPSPPFAVAVASKPFAAEVTDPTTPPIPPFDVTVAARPVTSETTEPTIPVGFTL